MSSRRSGPQTPERNLRREFFLLQHVQACRDALQYLRANRVVSGASVAIMAIAIALPSLMYVVIENQRTVLKGWGDKPSFTIFLKQNFDEASAVALLSRLASNPDTATIRFIHRDDAYAEFSRSSGLNLYGEAHPNPLPHVLILTPKAEVLTQDNGDGLKNLIEAETSVDLILADLMWGERLNAISLLVERSAALLAVVLVCGGILTVGNTTRQLVDEHYKEIRVHRPRMIDENLIIFHRDFVGENYK